MITSQSISLLQLLQRGHFVPAPVQREYQWTTAQTKQLLDDIFGAFQRSGADPGEAAAPETPETTNEEEPRDEEAGDEDADEEPVSLDIDAARLAETRGPAKARRAPAEYFLGGMILLRAPRAQGQYLVYDGLQRLTTISLLLAKLRDSGCPHPTVNAMLFADDGRPRLQVPTSGHTLAAAVNGRTLQRRTLTEGDFRMREAIELFAEELAEWSDARRAAFLRYFASNVWLTVTEVDDRSLAYQMFVAANARGLTLAVGDILKGQIVEHASKAGGTVSQIDTIARTWRTAQLRLRRSFDDFLHAVEVLRDRPAPEELHSPGERLLELFDDNTTADEIEAWAVERFAPLAGIFELTRVHLGLPASSGCDLLFRQLSFLGWKEWQPFYLALGLAQHERSGPSWERQISALQRACYIIELLGWSARKRKAVFLDAIGQLEEGLNPFKGRQGQVYGALSFPARLKAVAAHNLRVPLASDEKRGAIVRWIETLQWGKNVPRASTDDASIEHILPRTPKGDWEKAFSEDERERLTNRLGNLCVVPKEMNRRIGSEGWPVKLAEYQALRGSFKGALRAVDVAAATTPAGRPPAWTAAAVEQLTEELAAKAEHALQLRR